MQITRILLASVLAVATSSVCAQTSVSKAAVTGNRVGAISFNYDAPHDRLTADGLRFMAASKNSGITPTTGEIVVTVNITVVSPLKKGTDLHCSLLAVGGELDTTNGVIAGGLETANRKAKTAMGGGQSCTLVIPYAWTLPPDPAADTGLILAVGVSALGDKDDDGMVIRSTLQVGGVLPLPANGSTTTEAIDVVL